MIWRLKCLAFHLLKAAPFGHRVLIVLQRYVTGRYFQRVGPKQLGTPGFHVEQFKTLPPGSVALEFGCGRNLLTSLMLSHVGAARIYAFDLQRLATVAQVNDVITQLRGLLSGEWPAIASFEDLNIIYRIDYRAPADARSTGLPERSVDFVCSTATLEHVPDDEIRAILVECRRICTPRARLSFLIDYHDHYGTADARITLWNFYQYSHAQWKKFNPAKHYQNRLRHSDHQRIFTELGFSVISAERVIPDWSAVHLEQVRVCDDFRGYSREDLITANGRFVLAPPAAVDAVEAPAPWPPMLAAQAS